MWWDTALPQQFDEWKRHTGGVDSPSRVWVRRHLIEGGFKSVADFGCGLAVDAEPLTAAGVSYTGIDASEFLCGNAKARGVNVCRAAVDSVPLADQSVDASFCRHVLEHLDAPEPALREMIRVSRKSVYVILGTPPETADKCSNDPARGLSWNVWGMKRYSDFFLYHPRVLWFSLVAEVGQDGRGGGKSAAIVLELQ